ncbi:hypothetical protein BMT55_15505 [Listeria newyorkensis]|uniref:SnoaL-like domain-containing protein n=1 Tax=Listeria newyorkensis TaxID=1497681 RepID=A0ABX4XI21_9LIST|nr:hypothetical protein [Listeria newyorkensis]KGL45671.1 hypothetical protein EP58_02975 [Listeria newyorkensis]PNP88260.1 hypothetical protein BMT55_15505 [Listeria newyorkensis]WAO20742.1 hypothetical protein OTR81_10610 [Listeria newyorkensis]SQC55172.1 Uncharacterised protein [Listeria newyorkensis]
MNKQAIAESFSMGRFEEIYPYLSDSIEWHIIGEGTITGIENVIGKCEETSAYFKSVTTKCDIKNIITQNNQVVISGLAFFGEKDEISCINACDIYTFDDSGFIREMESYCIPIK